MAVDTRQKRFSMLSLGDGAHVYATFEADGAVDQDDRQHLLDCYSGINFASPGGATIIAQASGVARFVFSRIFGRVN